MYAVFGVSSCIGWDWEDDGKSTLEFSPGPIIRSMNEETVPRLPVKSTKISFLSGDFT